MFFGPVTSLFSAMCALTEILLHIFVPMKKGNERRRTKSKDFKFSVSLDVFNRHGGSESINGEKSAAAPWGTRNRSRVIVTVGPTVCTCPNIAGIEMSRLGACSMVGISFNITIQTC